MLGKVYAGQKRNKSWGIVGCVGWDRWPEIAFTHYRLITRAEDFTPPERRIKIEAGSYTRTQILELLGENES